MLTKLRKLVAQLGWRGAAWYALARLLAPCGLQLYRYHFMAQHIKPGAMRRAGGAIAVRPISALAQMPDGYPRPQAVLAARFRQGGHSLAAWHGACLAGFLWYQFGAYLEDEVRVRYCLPSPHSCWDYDVFVDAAYRLGPTFCRLWDEANCRLRARGVQWTCSRISAFNPDSLRAHRRMGARELGCANFFVAGRWQLMLADIAPFLHLSWGRHSMPQLVFDTSALDPGAKS